MPRNELTDRPGEVLGEQPQDRRAAHDRGLVSERRPRLACDRLELRPMPGDHVLVRRDDRLAGGERGGDEGPGRLLAAHDLDDHVGRAGHEVRRRVGQQVRRHAAAGCPRQVPCRHANELERACPGSESRRSTLQQPGHDLAPDRARAEHGNAQGPPRSLSFRSQLSVPGHRRMVARLRRASDQAAGTRSARPMR